MMTLSLEDLAYLPADERNAFLHRTPSMRPPNGTLPNFDDPESRALLPVAVTAVCVAVAVTCAVLRAYCRIFCLRMVTIADGLGLIALGFFLYTAWTVFDLANINALGVHQWDVRLSTFGDFLFGQYMLSSCYTLTLLFGKPAVILEWIRIFVPNGTRNTFFWMCWVMIVANVLIYSGLFTAVQFYCQPHRRIWMRWIPGTCAERRKVDSPSAIFNLFVDLIIVVLPQPTIWRLHVSRQRKFGISIVFSLGLLCIAAATGRTYEAFVFDYDGDVTYQSPTPFLWAVGECTCVLVVFCVPSIPRVFVDSQLSAALASLARCLGGRKHQTTAPGATSNKSARSWLATNTTKSSPRQTRRTRGSTIDGGDSQVHLADLEAGMEPSATEGSDIEMNIVPAQPRTLSILRTTEVTTEISPARSVHVQGESEHLPTTAEGQRRNNI